MADRCNAIYVGESKDAYGFPVSVYEDPVTKKRLLSYSLETWGELQRFIAQLKELNQREESRRYARPN